MTDQEYEQQYSLLADNIKQLPVSELKYHLWLLMVTLRSANTPMNRQLIKAAQSFTQSCRGLLEPSTDENDEVHRLTNTRTNLNTLIEISEVKTPAIVHQQYFLNVQGLWLGIVLGVIASGVGAIAGTGRAVYEKKNIAWYFTVGLATGLFLGMAIGFRTPKALFKDPVLRQLKFSLNGLEDCFNFLVKPHIPFTQCFNDEIRQLQHEVMIQNVSDKFYEQMITFQIVTAKAQFIDPSLKGYLGQHAFIKITLPGKVFTLEYALSPSKVDKKKPAPSEPRTVSMQKLLEMITLHQFLQQRHGCSKEHIIKKMKSGDWDCFNYINMLLLGTNQAATTLRRFNGTENFIGNNCVAFFVTKTSPFNQDALDFTGEYLSLG